MRILVVDNYDSFVYTLVQYLGQLGAECLVRRSDVVGPEDIGQCDGVLISPGAGRPEAAGGSVDVVQRCLADHIPLLGVCLGHQIIGIACHAQVDRAPELVHGHTSRIQHDGTGIYAGLPNPFHATRYHSLAVVPHTIPDEFTVTSSTDSDVVMGMRHRTLPVEGVQFRPESILTQGGHRLLGNWLVSAGHVLPPGLVTGLEDAMAAVQAPMG